MWHIICIHNYIIHIAKINNLQIGQIFTSLHSNSIHTSDYPVNIKNVMLFGGNYGNYHGNYDGNYHGMYMVYILITEKKLRELCCKSVKIKVFD